MSFLAANPAGFSRLSRARWSKLTRAHRPATTVANGAPFAADMPARIGLQLRRASFTNQPMTTLLWSVSAVMYPVFCLVTASGPFRRPTALGLLLRVPRPFGVSVLPKQVCKTRHKNAAQTSFGPLPESRPSAWEPGPLARLRPV